MITSFCISGGLKKKKKKTSSVCPIECHKNDAGMLKHNKN